MDTFGKSICVNLGINPIIWDAISHTKFTTSILRNSGIKILVSIWQHTNVICKVKGTDFGETQ